jgi:hypothetical protein
MVDAAKAALTVSRTGIGYRRRSAIGPDAKQSVTTSHAKWCGSPLPPRSTVMIANPPRKNSALSPRSINVH